MKYSIIVPVFNRPDEVDELLESLQGQEEKDFEVVIVEDGSQKPCKEVCDRHAGQLTLHYYYKENSGPGQSRNYGAERAQGEYLIILDSDVVLPDGYLRAVSDELRREPADAFGGPDRAHDSFTDTQKAISYSMTSFFTTGGIRGGKKKLDKFYPRSFNMGIRRDVYRELGGFSKMRFGEDIDFSIRIFKAGRRCRLFPEAWVWHKRRTDFRKFWRQVYNSGIARINLYRKYPESLKLVHLLPMVFTIGVGLCLLSTLTGLICWLLQAFVYFPSAENGWGATLFFDGIFLMSAGLAPLVLYSLLIMADSTLQNKSVNVGLRSVMAAFVQLTGYGCGFLNAWWKRCVLGKDEFSAYEKTFYK
ncbi:MAG: glycosyltransferase [Prevotella sp.]|nr:glycosyltransferase [Prevotella sp.]